MALELHHYAWISGGIFTFVAVLGSLIVIYLHMRHWTEPTIQKYIVRIILMVPIYTIDSYLSLLFKEYSLYFNVARDW
jgi:hypothetical protein